MAIRVRFAKNGCYHPAFGRLGRGKNEGKVYVLPDSFGEQETVEVPVFDATARPRRQTGSRTVTRYKYLPSSCEVLDEKELEKQIEEAKYDPEADAPVIEKPRMAQGTEKKLPKDAPKKRRTSVKRPELSQPEEA